MTQQEVSSVAPVDAQSPASAEDDMQSHWRRVVGRRSFLQSVGLAGAAAVPGSAVLASSAMARSHAIGNGDVAILRFLAAAELIETDLWQQYNELGGVNGGNPSYMAALSNLDGDMSQYITDNTDDEVSHAAFLNAYLRSKGAQPVKLDEFRTLPSSKATGAKQTGRLTNLQALDVDTSWYTRYRSGLARTSGPRSPRRSRSTLSRRFRSMTPTPGPEPRSQIHPLPPRRFVCRPSRTLQGFTSHTSSKVDRASTPRWR